MIGWLEFNGAFTRITADVYAEVKFNRHVSSVDEPSVWDKLFQSTFSNRKTQGLKLDTWPINDPASPLGEVLSRNLSAEFN